MKIFAIVRKDASSTEKSCANRNPVNWGFVAMLESIHGTKIEIDTKYLFLNQFNTVDGVGSKNGMRLMATHLESLELVDTTFEEIKEIIKARYLKDWNQKLTDANFSAWKSLLK